MKVVVFQKDGQEGSLWGTLKRIEIDNVINMNPVECAWRLHETMCWACCQEKWRQLIWTYLIEWRDV